MNYTFFDFLILVGSLGLFLFGMKLMSEALQKIAGNKMRSILSAMTSTRVTGVLTGVLITAVIQSSSATTVMIVSFVNAGLLTLTQSIGVIMGANIGTTVTAWIVSLLGFNVKISVIALPLIGIGFPFLFSKNSRTNSWGEFIIGFAILFMGLEYLKDAVPDIKSNPEILSFLSNYTDLGFGSTLIFLFIGVVLTLIIQSSSATLALTLVMCNNGWIPFELGAAMVLGENIGTTITANLAALMANISARRAALAHSIFNLFGVIWVLFVFQYFLEGIAYIMVQSGSTSPFEDVTSIPIALSMFHTIFNFMNVIFLIWFVNLIVKTVTWLAPQKKGFDEEYRLVYISTGILSTSELSILQARKEIAVVAKRASKMMTFIPEMLKDETKLKQISEIQERLAKYEEIIDRMEIEIANYISKISESGLSGTGSVRVKSMLRIIDELESISDVCFNIGLNLEKKRNENIEFSPVMNENILRMFSLVNLALDEMNRNLDVEYHDVTIQKSVEIEAMINKYRDELKAEHLDSIKDKVYTYEAGTIYNTIISLCEKIGDHSINVNEAIVGCKSEKVA
jgi:phosphate:Na+ symporter